MLRFQVGAEMEKGRGWVLQEGREGLGLVGVASCRPKRMFMLMR